MSENSYTYLLAEISKLQVIDAHNHLRPEAQRIAMDVDFFTLLDIVYSIGDLETAGMPVIDIAKLNDQGLSLSERWQLLEPYWNRIRYTGYARAMQRSMREFFGIGEVNHDSVLLVSEKMKKSNKPGLYEKILRQKCNIKYVLNQHSLAPKNDPLLRTVMRYDEFALYCADSFGTLEQEHADLNLPLNSAEDLKEAVLKRARAAVLENGCVGIKLICGEYPEPLTELVNSALNNARNLGTISPGDKRLFQSLLCTTLIEAAIELDVPVAVHIGPGWTSWVDFHNFRPGFIAGWLQKYRDAKFDLYHLGIPWQDEAIVMAKMYPNAWLNLCWTHIFSPRITIESISRIIDLVPSNKVIAFGADYVNSVENVYGHLSLARENIAIAFSKCIEQGVMNTNQAIELAADWFFNNPTKLYKL